MNNEIWKSEVVTYGLMILNLLAVGVLLLWAWRRGHLRDLESAGEVVHADKGEADHER